MASATSSNSPLGANLAREPVQVAPQYWQFLRELSGARYPTEAWLAGKKFYVAPIFQVVAITVCLLCAANAYSLIQRIYARGGVFEMPIYPAVCAIAMALIVPFTKERAKGTYFAIAWTYVVVMSIFGFLGMSAIALRAVNFKYIIEVVLKPWFALVPIPWLVIRTVSPDKLPRFQKIITLLVVLGAIIGILQMVVPQYFSYIMTSTGRASGFWENPNTAGMILLVTFYLSFIPVWQNKSLAIFCRTVIFICMVLTFSRTAILGFILAGIFYTLSIGKVRQMIGFGLILLLGSGGFYVFASMVEQDIIPLDASLKNRVVSILAMFTGDLENKEISGSRFYLWEGAIEQIQREGSLLFGVGHGGLYKVWKYDLSVHNDYLQHLGTAGVIGLVMYLAFYAMLCIQAYQCKNLRVRAGILATTIVFMTYGFFGSNIFSHHTVGPFMAIIAMWLHYGRSYPDDSTASAMKQAARMQLASGDLIPAPQ